MCNDVLTPLFDRDLYGTPVIKKQHASFEEVNCYKVILFITIILFPLLSFFVVTFAVTFWSEFF